MPTPVLVRDIEDLSSEARCVFQVLLRHAGLSLDLPQVAEAASMGVEEAQRSLHILLNERHVEQVPGTTGRPRYSVR